MNFAFLWAVPNHFPAGRSRQIPSSQRRPKSEVRSSLRRWSYRHSSHWRRPSRCPTRSHQPPAPEYSTAPTCRRPAHRLVPLPSSQRRPRSKPRSSRHRHWPNWKLPTKFPCRSCPRREPEPRSLRMIRCTCVHYPVGHCHRNPNNPHRRR